MALKDILLNLPEVAPPAQKRLSFKEKLKWTGIVLVLYFVMSIVSLFGLGQNALQQFEYLSVILGASFGSIISLGIGPIVTASIVLQLLNGSGILKFDLTTTEGKATFQGVQKALSIFFIIFEAIMTSGFCGEGIGDNALIKICLLTPAAINKLIPEPKPHLDTTSSRYRIIIPPKNNWKASNISIVK